MIDEFDEFTLIHFVQKGMVLIGFQFNKEKKYCLKYKDKCVIGAYGASFNCRAAFIYTTQTYVEGFFIRKSNWIDCLEENPQIKVSMLKNVLLQYMTKINIKVKLAKKRALQLVENRHDIELVNISYAKDDLVDKRRVEN